MGRYMSHLSLQTNLMTVFQTCNCQEQVHLKSFLSMNKYTVSLLFFNGDILLFF
jgi:heme/copper-type cytochrome/quinol oxidase subunit 4